MHQLAHHFLQFLKDEEGPTAVEYAIMLALIVVVCIGAVHALGRDAKSDFSYVATKASST
jgi:pilus assembly protein Flp/PilA